MHLRPLTIVFLMSAATAGFTQTYKWVDQNGVVSYSQTPPPSTQAETVDITPTPVVGNSDNSDELQRLRQRLEDSREDRELAKEEERKTREAAEIKRQNCSTARSNLENLLNSGNRMMKTTDGDYLRLSESERQTRIQAAREQIEANCKN
jgi:flagellar biosynthesis GTPase FlhF